MLVNEFGKFIAATRYENLPADVIATVKLRVLDLLAAGLAGYHLGRHKQLLPILGGAGTASAWGWEVSLRCVTRRCSIVSSRILCISTTARDLLAAIRPPSLFPAR